MNRKQAVNKMRKENIIDYLSLEQTFEELVKAGYTGITLKLLNIMRGEALPKPTKHNKKDDKTTSYYKVDLTEEELEMIHITLILLESESA